MEISLQRDDEQVQPMKKERPAEVRKRQARVAISNEEVDQIILSHPSLTVKQLADLCGVSVTTISRRIASLKKRGLLTGRRNTKRAARATNNASASTSTDAGQSNVDGTTVESGTPAGSGDVTHNSEKSGHGLLAKIMNYLFNLCA